MCTKTSPFSRFPRFSPKKIVFRFFSMRVWGRTSVVASSPRETEESEEVKLWLLFSPHSCHLSLSLSGSHALKFYHTHQQAVYSYISQVYTSSTVLSQSVPIFRTDKDKQNHVKVRKFVLPIFIVLASPWKSYKIRILNRIFVRFRNWERKLSCRLARICFRPNLYYSSSRTHTHTYSA